IPDAERDAVLAVLAVLTVDLDRLNCAARAPEPVISMPATVVLTVAAGALTGGLPTDLLPTDAEPLLRPLVAVCLLAVRGRGVLGCVLLLDTVAALPLRWLCCTGVRGNDGVAPAA
ncbi:hypothetical protein IWW54_007138, partial [Coemansia sp. RSA 2705]